MEYYSLRITPKVDDADTREVVRKWFDKNAQAYVATVESASRIHYQCWLQSRSKRDILNKSLRYALKDRIEKGNSGAAFNEEAIRDPEALARYVCKGTRESLPTLLCAYTLDYDDSYIGRYHEAYWQENAKIKSSQKQKRLGLYEQLEEYGRSLVGGHHTDQRRLLVRKYLELCVEIDKPICVFNARRVVNLVWAKINPDGMQALEDEIFSKM